MSSYQTLISPDVVAGNLDNPAFRIVDCRHSLAQPEQGQVDYANGHIPGAVYANLDTDLAAPISKDSGRHPLPDVKSFILTLQQWGISNDSQVVVYDDAGGGIAARLWWMLRWVGHLDVAVIDGGMAAWTRGGHSTSQESLPPATGSFVGVADSGAVWKVEAIESWLAAGEGFLLIDARAAARYRGEQEPIDPVAGHVPGALCLPFTDVLHEDGTWRTVEEVRTCWEGVIPIAPEVPWGVMCGSGVTACHLALSANIAGLPDPCLYVGSWSEWLRDSSRPIATVETRPSE